MHNKVGDVKLIVYNDIPVEVLCRITQISGDGWITCESYGDPVGYSRCSYYNFWNIEEQGVGEVFDASEEEWMITVMKGRYEKTSTG